MKEVRNLIHKILNNHGINTGYIRVKNPKLPYSVFFLLNNQNITAANNRYITTPTYQVSYFFKLIEDDLLEAIRNEFIEEGFFVDEWQEGAVDDGVTDQYHYYLEIQYIG